MSGFSIHWLDLREPADQAARDLSLLRQSLVWLERAASRLAGPCLIADLGAGTGSTLRAFQLAGAVAAHWRLVDLDEQLLAEATRRHGQQLETCRADLTLVAELPLADASLITASALFDLASAEFCDALLARLHQHRAALYAALNYDGDTHWSPAHPLDQAVLTAFNRDQLRDKGMGPALGPGATAYLTGRLQSLGYTVHTAPSPWRLGGEQRDLVEALITGIADAVAGDPALQPTALAQWREFRLRHAATGTCVVGHQDILALPPD